MARTVRGNISLSHVLALGGSEACPEMMNLTIYSPVQLGILDCLKALYWSIPEAESFHLTFWFKAIIKEGELSQSCALYRMVGFSRAVMPNL